MFLTIVIMLSIGASMAQDFVVNGIGYQIISGTNVRAHSAVNYAGALTIPATVVNGATTYTVLEVRNYFMEKTTSTSITSVSVSEGIQSIGIGVEGSFNCDNRTLGR